MPLTLATYGTNAGYSITKLCSINYSVGTVQTNTFATPRSTNINDGWFVSSNSLPNNNDNQGLPGSPRITGTSTATFFAGDRVNTYAANYTGGSNNAGTGIRLYRVVNATLTGAQLLDYTDGTAFTFMAAGFTPYGISNRASQKVYIPTVVDGNLKVIEVDTPSVSASVFLNYGTYSPNTVHSLAFADDTQRLYVLFSNGSTYRVEKVNVATATVEQTWTFPAFDLSTFPYTQFKGIAVLRGGLEGKWLLSCAKRATAFTQSLAIVEFDSTVAVSEASFNDVAVGDVVGTSSVEITSILTFGEDFVLQADRGAGGLGGQLTKLHLPSGTTADNDADGPTGGGGGGGGGGDTGTVWSRSTDCSTTFSRGAQAVCGFSRGASCSTSWSRGSSC